MNDLIEAYIDWFAPQVRVPRVSRTHYGLMGLMFEKEYVWTVPNDNNRLVDGLDVRREFLSQSETLVYLDELGPCTFLEVLVGLSRRVAFQVGGMPCEWAWQLMHNLEFHRMCDPLSPRKVRQINDIMDGVIWRNYAADGQGGFFPLAWPTQDQRNVELWYQMSAWIDEMHQP